MKIAALQPPYPYRPADMPALVEWLTTRLDECDASLDLIVLPEACDAMSSYPDYAAFEADVEAYCQPLLDKARATAIRCGALVAINLYKGPKGHYRNVTVLFDAAGNVAGEYFKQHLPQAEREGKRLDDAYTRAYHAPYTLDLDGVRYAFLTCYDNYYNEYIQHIALKKPDVLIVSSLQRGERMDILEMQMKNAAFTCNAWAVRASVSMGGEDCGHGANTMIVAPDGRVLASLGQKTGMLARDVDAKFKHMRADSYGQPPVLNDFFISKGRTPWAYRACGAGVIPGDRDMPYPRICAHRGFNYVAPENSLPAFGAAVALGCGGDRAGRVADEGRRADHFARRKRKAPDRRGQADFRYDAGRGARAGHRLRHASPLRRAAAFPTLPGGFRSLRPPNHREPAHQVAPRLHGV